MSPIRTFITRPVFTGMLTLVVVVFGLVAYPRIGVDQFPDIDFPIVTVTTILPGADPEAIERTVTEPLEEALNTLPGLDTLRSVNVDNVSQIIVRFDLERNVDVAAQDVRDKVQATLSKLPREIEVPVVQKFDIGAVPVVTLAFSGKLPIERLTKVAEDEVKPRLQQIAGVGSVTLLGGRKREITVTVSPDLAKGYGLSPTDVVAAVRAQSVDVPGGRTLEPGVERTVKLAGEARTVEALRALIVASPGGVPVRLGQVAEVVDGPAEARSSARLGGGGRHRPRRPEAVRVEHRRGRRGGEGEPRPDRGAAPRGEPHRDGRGRLAVHPRVHQLREGGHDPRRRPRRAGRAPLPAQLPARRSSPPWPSPPPSSARSPSCTRSGSRST